MALLPYHACLPLSCIYDLKLESIWTHPHSPERDSVGLSYAAHGTFVLL